MGILVACTLEFTLMDEGGAPPSAPACSRRARDGCRRETIGMVKGGDGGQRPTQQRVGSLPYPTNKRPSGLRRPGTHPGPWNQLPHPHVGVSPDPWLGGSTLRFTNVDGSNFPPPGGGTSGHNGGTGGGYSLGGCSNLCSGSSLPETPSPRSLQRCHNPGAFIFANSNTSGESPTGGVFSP